METIIECGTNKYLSEVISDLPINCIFNKGVTGCGGTTVALQSSKPYIICVPYISIINNKMKDCKRLGIDVQPVYGGISAESINKFRGNKYLVTYDSLPRISKLINTKSYNLLVDEAHNIVSSASYRGKAISAVLNLYKEYNSFTFMTATPIPNRFLPDELSKVNVTIAKWDNIKPVHINRQYIKGSLQMTIASIASDYINGTKEGNLHIFINSVDLITKISRLISKVIPNSNDSINYIVAMTEDNEDVIQRTTFRSKGISIVGDVNKVNFYTATAFEGSDIYDKDAKILIVTDGTRDYTKYNIECTIPQIIGRIRDVDFTTIDLLYTSSLHYPTVSEQVFSDTILNRLKSNTSFISKCSDWRADPTSKQALELLTQRGSYIIFDGAEFVVNSAAYNCEMFNFHALNYLYYVNRNEDGVKTVSTESKVTLLNQTRYTTVDFNYNKSINPLFKVKVNRVPSFVELAKMYCEATPEWRTLEADAIEDEYSIIPKAFHKLGADKMKALMYRKGAIEAAMASADKSLSNSYKIMKHLSSKGYCVGSIIPFDDVKRDIADALLSIGSKEVAKANMILNLYVCSRTNCKDSTGKYVNAYKLLSPCILVGSPLKSKVDYGF